MADSEDWEDVADDWEDVPVADTGVSGSPLEQALKSQMGEVVTVETPTGDARFDRQGRRVLSGEEYSRTTDLDNNDFKQWLLGGALSFMGGGGKLIDEMRGADAAVKTGLQVAGAGGNPIEPMRDSYNKTRNVTRKQVMEEQVKHPIAGVAGAVAPYLVAPGAATAGGRIAVGSATAGLDELGGSTSEDFGDVAKDVLKATALGGAFSGVGEGLFSGLRWVGGKALGEAGKAADVVRSGIQGLKDKAVSSAAGKVGNIGTQQMNVADHLIQIIDHPNLFPPAIVQEARAFAATPAGMQVLERGARNAFAKGPSLLNQEAAAQGALAQSIGAADPALVATEAASKVLPGNVASDVGGKFMSSVGQRAALSLAGGAAGNLAADQLGLDRSMGTLGGVGMGFATPRVLQFARNTVRSPAVQSAANQVAGDLFIGAANLGSKGARVMTPALAQEGRQNAYAKLMEQFGIQPEDDEDASTKGFILSQREPSMQSK